VRLVFLGSPSAAVESLQALIAAEHEVALVVTGADRRRGRGSSVSPTPVGAAARDLGLPIEHDLSSVTKVGADLAIVVAYGALIPSAVLDQLNMLNVHFSLLPRWRGAAPVQRAILAGDPETGVCVMGLEATLDTGPVYARASTPIEQKHAVDLTNELALMGAQLLVETLVHSLLPVPTVQVGEPTYARKLTAIDFVLDPLNSALQLSRIVRSGHGTLCIGDRRLIVLSASASNRSLDAGRMAIDEAGVILGTSDGALVLHDVRPAGSSTMDARAWSRGSGLDLAHATWSRGDSLRP
jgi:methionyl-tRNA formyltransferase